MYAKIVLGLFTVVLMAGDTWAQSGGRSYRPAAAAQRKLERMQTSEIQRFARKIEKENFAGVRLESRQKRALKEIVKSNYDGLAMVEKKMVSMIPPEDAKDLKRYYSSALRKGSTEAEAMMSSMQSVGFAEPLQEKIMMLSKESDAVMEEIAGQFASQLSDEQRKVLMAKEEMAKEEMAKEEMAKEEMAKEKEMMKDEKMMKDEMVGQKTEMGVENSDLADASQSHGRSLE